jgi:hypothetical protein
MGISWASYWAGCRPQNKLIAALLIVCAYYPVLPATSTFGKILRPRYTLRGGGNVVSRVGAALEASRRSLKDDYDEHPGGILTDSTNQDPMGQVDARERRAEALRKRLDKPGGGLVATKSGSVTEDLSFLKNHNYDYDLVVIGGGSGGLACSKEAAELGAKVIKHFPQERGAASHFFGRNFAQCQNCVFLPNGSESESYVRACVFQSRTFARCVWLLLSRKSLTCISLTPQDKSLTASWFFMAQRIVHANTLSYPMKP